MAMNGYTKLFNSIIASTVWSEPHTTRIVWISMLAMANQRGIVEASIPGLAVLARVTREECEEAIKILESPDPDSRSTEYEGRRIQKVDGGWLILNHAKYRAKLNADERREYNRIKQQEFRAKKSANVNDVIDKSAQSAHTDSDTDTEADTKAETHTTASVSPLGSPEFKTFFDAYPIQVNRRAALHEWVKQRLDSVAGEVMLSLARWKDCERWKLEQFIANPEKWLAEQWKAQPVKGKNEQKRQGTKQAIERVRAGLD